jgi:hypothetical protein
VVDLASQLDQAAVDYRSARLRLHIERPGAHRILLYDADDGALIDAGTFHASDDGSEELVVRWPDDVDGARVPLEPRRRYVCEVRRESDGALLGRCRFETPRQRRHRSGVHTISPAPAGVLQRFRTR